MPPSVAGRQRCCGRAVTISRVYMLRTSHTIRGSGLPLSLFIAFLIFILAFCWGNRGPTMQIDVPSPFFDGRKGAEVIDGLEVASEHGSTSPLVGLIRFAAAQSPTILNCNGPPASVTGGVLDTSSVGSIALRYCTSAALTATFPSAVTEGRLTIGLYKSALDFISEVEVTQSSVPFGLSFAGFSTSAQAEMFGATIYIKRIVVVDSEISVSRYRSALTFSGHFPEGTAIIVQGCRLVCKTPDFSTTLLTTDQSFTFRRNGLMAIENNVLTVVQRQTGPTGAAGILMSINFRVSPTASGNTSLSIHNNTGYGIILPSWSGPDCGVPLRASAGTTLSYFHFIHFLVVDLYAGDVVEVMENNFTVDASAYSDLPFVSDFLAFNSGGGTSTYSPALILRSGSFLLVSRNTFAGHAVSNATVSAPFLITVSPFDIRGGVLSVTENNALLNATPPDESTFMILQSATVNVTDGGSFKVAQNKVVVLLLPHPCLGAGDTTNKMVYHFIFLRLDTNMSASICIANSSRLEVSRNVVELPTSYRNSQQEEVPITAKLYSGTVRLLTIRVGTFAVFDSSVVITDNIVTAFTSVEGVHIWSPSAKLLGSTTVAIGAAVYTPIGALFALFNSTFGVHRNALYGFTAGAIVRPPLHMMALFYMNTDDNRNFAIDVVCDVYSQIRLVNNTLADATADVAFSDRETPALSPAEGGDAVGVGGGYRYDNTTDVRWSAAFSGVASLRSYANSDVPGLHSHKVSAILADMTVQRFVLACGSRMIVAGNVVNVTLSYGSTNSPTSDIYGRGVGTATSGLVRVSSVDDGNGGLTVGFTWQSYVRAVSLSAITVRGGMALALQDFLASSIDPSLLLVMRLSGEVDIPVTSLGEELRGLTPSERAAQENARLGRRSLLSVFSNTFSVILDRPILANKYPVIDDYAHYGVLLAVGNVTMASYCGVEVVGNKYLLAGVWADHNSNLRYPAFVQLEAVSGVTRAMWFVMGRGAHILVANNLCDTAGENDAKVPKLIAGPELRLVLVGTAIRFWSSIDHAIPVGMAPPHITTETAGSILFDLPLIPWAPTDGLDIAGAAWAFVAKTRGSSSTFATPLPSNSFIGGDGDVGGGGGEAASQLLATRVATADEYVSYVGMYIIGNRIHTMSVILDAAGATPTQASSPTGLSTTRFHGTLFRDAPRFLLSFDRNVMHYEAQIAPYDYFNEAMGINDDQSAARTFRDTAYYDTITQIDNEWVMLREGTTTAADAGNGVRLTLRENHVVSDRSVFRLLRPVIRPNGYTNDTFVTAYQCDNYVQTCKGPHPDVFKERYLPRFGSQLTVIFCPADYGTASRSYSLSASAVLSDGASKSAGGGGGGPSVTSTGTISHGGNTSSATVARTTPTSTFSSPAMKLMTQSETLFCPTEAICTGLYLGVEGAVGSPTTPSPLHSLCYDNPLIAPLFGTTAASDTTPADDAPTAASLHNASLVATATTRSGDFLVALQRDGVVGVGGGKGSGSADSNTAAPYVVRLDQYALISSTAATTTTLPPTDADASTPSSTITGIIYVGLYGDVGGCPVVTTAGGVASDDCAWGPAAPSDPADAQLQKEPIFVLPRGKNITLSRAMPSPAAYNTTLVSTTAGQPPSPYKRLISTTGGGNTTTATVPPPDATPLGLTTEVVRLRYASYRSSLDTTSTNTPPPPTRLVGAWITVRVPIVVLEHDELMELGGSSFVGGRNLATAPEELLSSSVGGEGVGDASRPGTHFPIVGLDIGCQAFCWSAAALTELVTGGGSSSAEASTIIARTIALEVPIRRLPKPTESLPPTTTTLPQATLPAPATAAQAGTATGVIVAAGGGIIVPVAAMQQGVAMALLRMAECEEDPLDGESLPLLVHLLQFPIGEGTFRYARGAVVGNLVILPVVWGVLSYFVFPKLIGTYITKETVELARIRAGWPSVLLLPFAMFAEGSGMASVALATATLVTGSTSSTSTSAADVISGGGEAAASDATAGDVALGIFGLAVCIGSVAAWVFMLRKRLPLRFMELRFVSRPKLLERLAGTRWQWEIVGMGKMGGSTPSTAGKIPPPTKVSQRETTQSDGHEELLLSSADDGIELGEVGLKSPVAALVATGDTHQHQQPAHEQQQQQAHFTQMMRYNHAYDEFWWLWSAVCGYGFSLLVGISEGMPNNTLELCRVRWALACVGAICQSLCVLTCTIPLQLALLGLTGGLIVVLVGLVAASVFSVSGKPSAANSDAINTVSTLNSIIGILLMVVGIGRLVLEYVQGRRSGWSGGGRSRRFQKVADAYEGHADDLNGGLDERFVAASHHNDDDGLLLVPTAGRTNAEDDIDIGEIEMDLSIIPASPSKPTTIDSIAVTKTELPSPPPAQPAVTALAAKHDHADATAGSGGSCRMGSRGVSNNAHGSGYDHLPPAYRAILMEADVVAEAPPTAAAAAAPQKNAMADSTSDGGVATTRRSPMRTSNRHSHGLN